MALRGGSTCTPVPVAAVKKGQGEKEKTQKCVFTFHFSLAKNYTESTITLA
jgi:hypothetical protein